MKLTEREMKELKHIAIDFWESRESHEDYIKSKVDSVNRATEFRHIYNMFDPNNKEKYINLIEDNELRKKVILINEMEFYGF